MRTPEVPIESKNISESLPVPEEKKSLTLRLAKAIEKRTSKSEEDLVIAFNRYNTSHVVLEAKDGKLIADWRTHAKGIVFTGRISLSESGEVLGMSADALYPSKDPAKKDVFIDFDGGIDPQIPYRIQGSIRGPEFDQYEVPLNTVVQIAENGHLISY